MIDIYIHMIISEGVFTPSVRTNNIIAQIGNIQILTVSNCYLSTLNVDYVIVSGNVNIGGNLSINSDLTVNGNTFLNEVDVSGNLTVYGNTFLNEVDVSGNMTLNNSLIYSSETIDASGNLSTNTIVSLIDCSGYVVGINLSPITTIGQLKIITVISGSCDLNVTLTDGNNTAQFNTGSSLNLLSTGTNGWAVLDKYDVNISLI